MIGILEKNTAIFYNTFIGGISPVTNTTALLATKLGISVGNISNFTIVGADVKCKIIGSYFIPASAFQGNTAITYYNDAGGLVTELRAYSFYGATAFKWFVFNNVTSVLIDALQNTLLTTIYLPSLTSCANAAFRSINLFKQKIFIPNCATLGSNVNVNEDVFFGVALNSKIYAKPSLATINLGGVEADLAFATTNLSTVKYVSSTAIPNAITDLAAGTIYDTAIQLNFTAPTGSTNAIEHYEVYVNGVYYSDIKRGGWVSKLTINTAYSFTVYARDIYYNQSLVSNSVSASTTNTSVVSLNEKTIAAYHLLTDSLDSKGTNDAYNGSSLTFSSGAVFTSVANSYIELNHDNDLSFVNGSTEKAFSISGWAKWTANFHIISKGRNDYNTAEEWVMMTNAGNLYFRLTDKATNGVYLRFSITNPFTTTYKHFAITYDGSKTIAGLKLYINGTLQTVTNASAGTYTGMKKGVLPVVLGSTSGSKSLNFAGALKEVHFFNAELTSGDVTTLQTTNFPF